MNPTKKETPTMADIYNYEKIAENLVKKHHDEGGKDNLLLEALVVAVLELAHQTYMSRP